MRASTRIYAAIVIIIDARNGKYHANKSLKGNGWWQLTHATNTAGTHTHSRDHELEPFQPHVWETKFMQILMTRSNSRVLPLCESQASLSNYKLRLSISPCNPNWEQSAVGNVFLIIFTGIRATTHALAYETIYMCVSLYSEWRGVLCRLRWHTSTACA